MLAAATPKVPDGVKVKAAEAFARRKCRLMLNVQRHRLDAAGALRRLRH